VVLFPSHPKYWMRWTELPIAFLRSSYKITGPLFVKFLKTQNAQMHQRRYLAGATLNCRSEESRVIRIDPTQ
jgi:hypothetical protein